MKNSYVREIAITGLVLLETSALWTHTDGVYFGLVVAAVSGIAGFTIGKTTCEAKP